MTFQGLPLDGTEFVQVYLCSCRHGKVVQDIRMNKLIQLQHLIIRHLFFDMFLRIICYCFKNRFVIIKLTMFYVHFLHFHLESTYTQLQ